MRDRRAPWPAVGPWVTGDHLRKTVAVRMELGSGHISTYGAAPKGDVGRRVILTLTPEECLQLERQLARMRVAVELHDVEG